MSSNNERKTGTARELCDQIQINNRDIEPAVVKGLTGAGFDVEIEPNFKQEARGFPPMPEGSTVKVYRKVWGLCED